MEFESFNEALLYIGIEEGGSAPVDSLLAIIDLKELTLVELQTFKAKGAEERRSPTVAAEPKSAPAEKSEPLHKRHQLMANVF
jgi:pyruvate dehydrogenase E2 component (dihydrolipoamide acetyltransferase)